MTPQEAITIFKDQSKQFAAKADGAYEYNDFIKAKEVAITALEKQIPKKPLKSDRQEIRYSLTYDCPNCGKKFTGAGIANYCYHCGQALDWQEELS